MAGRAAARSPHQGPGTSRAAGGICRLAPARGDGRTGQRPGRTRTAAHDGTSVDRQPKGVTGASRRVRPRRRSCLLRQLHLGPVPPGAAVPARPETGQPVPATRRRQQAGLRPPRGQQPFLAQPALRQRPAAGAQRPGAVAHAHPPLLRRGRPVVRAQRRRPLPQPGQSRPAALESVLPPPGQDPVRDPPGRHPQARPVLAGGSGPLPVGGTAAPPRS